MLIEANGLTKTYRTGPVEVRAVRAVDLRVVEGEFVALTGPSGSGKSTLLHVLGCLDRPSGGSYQLDGVAVARLSDSELSRLRNARIGFVFQAFNLIPQQTVLENVELPLVYAGQPKRLRRERSLEILRRVGLESKLRQRPPELSGGEAQRVAVARALVVRPLLLLADEPTGSLDTEIGETIIQLLVELNRAGTTVVLVTHNPDLAARADRGIQMKDGRIVSDSRPR